MLLIDTLAEALVVGHVELRLILLVCAEELYTPLYVDVRWRRRAQLDLSNLDASIGGCLRLVLHVAYQICL